MKYIFGKNKKIDELFINENIIFIYENILKLNYVEIDINIIEGFSNLVNKNNEIRKIFIKKNLLKIFGDLIIKYINKNYEGNFFYLYVSFVNFLYNYFSVIPYLKYEKMKRYFFFIFQFYFVKDFSFDLEDEKKILKFLGILTLLNKVENDYDIIKDENSWGLFTKKLILNLERGIEIKKLSLKIIDNFLNLQDIDYIYNLRIIFNENFFNLLKYNLEPKIKNLDCFKVFTSILSNMFKINFFMEKILKTNNFIGNLINFMSDNKNDNNYLFYILCIFSDFFKNEKNLKVINDYSLNNLNLIDYFIKLIEDDINREIMILLSEIIGYILKIGEIGKKNFDVENPFTKRVLDYEKLATKLENSLSHHDLDVYNNFLKILKDYFEYDEY